MVEQAHRYDEISAQEALDDYHSQGGRKLDLDNGTNQSRREDRRAFMTERLNDTRADEEPEDNNREYDLDNHKDRVDYAVERLNGTEFQDAEPDEAA
jgi:hypothetical protein